jgi:hypothetical protein
MLCIIAFSSPMIDNEDMQNAIHIICPTRQLVMSCLFFGVCNAANQETGIFAIEAW